jgi:hypothetical protein
MKTAPRSWRVVQVWTCPPFVRTLPAAALRILSQSFLVPKFLALNFVSVSTYSVPLPRVVAAGGRRSGG